MSGPPVVLASGSETRARLLREAGVEIHVDPARIDEAGIKAACRAEGGTALQTAETLAEMKAARISAKYPGALVIGADQMLDRDGEWFDKPADRDAARAQLTALRGTTHVLATSVVAVRDGGYVWHHNAEARLTMRDFSDAFLDAYLDEVGAAALTSVGGYQLEGRGAQLFATVEGDFFTVLGLPLLPLLDFLRENKVLIR